MKRCFILSRCSKLRAIAAILMIIVLFTTLVLAQESSVNRDKYYNVRELIRLIEKAREAGISDEELKGLEIRDGDQEINVLEYIEAEKLERLRKNQKLKELLNKKFLTVNDIYNELIKSEPEVIKKLREELVSER